MDYEIDVCKEKGFVRIQVYRSITADLERSFAKEVIDAAKQNGLRHYVADVRGVPNVADPLHQYKLAYEEMASFGLDRTSQIGSLVFSGF